MKLLFNKSNNGTAELKELLGFLDANLKYDNLRSDLNTATKEIIKFIGKETYALVQFAYDKPDPTDDEKDLIFSVRYPIAIQAYRKFAPSNDVIHSGNGRLNRVEEHEKPAFEWQIDRDNKSLERRYYGALDDMIDYLDENTKEWKESTNFKATHDLFIRNTSDFDKYFNIGSSRLLMIMLAPGMRLSENNDIKQRIGTDLFNNMKLKLKGENVDGFTLDENLLEKIREAIVYKSLAWAMPRLSVQLYPEGVLQGYTSDRVTSQSKMPPLNAEVHAAAQLFNNDAQTVLYEIERLIEEKNKTTIEKIPPEPLQFTYNLSDKFINT